MAKGCLNATEKQSTGAAITGSYTLTANPNLVAPGLTLSADLHLQPGSPAINVGDNTNAAATDYDGNARPYGAVVDTGAFEKQPSLPVESLSELQARALPSKGMELYRATATERNANRFEIQRGTDGFSFEKIGKVAARGTTNKEQQYRFGDKNPNTGTNYYRLRQIDHDGTASLGNIAAVAWRVPELHVFPNPVTDIFEIKSDLAWESAKLRNAMGQVVREFSFSAKNSLAGLPNGVYTIAIFSDKNEPLQILRVMKQ